MLVLAGQARGLANKAIAKDTCLGPMNLKNIEFRFMNAVGFLLYGLQQFLILRQSFRTKVSHGFSGKRKKRATSSKIAA